MNACSAPLVPPTQVVGAWPRECQEEERRPCRAESAACRLAAAVWIEDVGRRRHVWWPGQLRCPDRLTLQPHPLCLSFRLGIHWRTQPGEHLLEGIHGKHPTPRLTHSLRVPGLSQAGRSRLVGRPPCPEGRGASTSKSHPYAIFRRAMGRGNVTGESDAFRRKSNTGRFTARTGAITRSAARG